MWSIACYNNGAISNRLAKHPIVSIAFIGVPTKSHRISMIEMITFKIKQREEG